MRNIGLIGAYRDSVKVGVGERKGVTIHAVTTGEEEVLVAHRTPVGIQKLLCVWKAAKPQGPGEHASSQLSSSQTGFSMMVSLACFLHLLGRLPSPKAVGIMLPSQDHCTSSFFTSLD